MENSYILLKQKLETDLHCELVYEYQFDELINDQVKKRLWRFDFAIPKYKIAIEVEGGIFGFYTQRGYKKTGGHNSVDGMKRDVEKYNKAVCLGWSIFRILASDAKTNLYKMNELSQLIKHKIGMLKFKTNSTQEKSK